MDENLKENFKKIKAVMFDVDGVFFSGQVFIHPTDGEFLKPRSFVDGQGISLLRAIGIRIAFITGEHGFISYIVEKLNALPSVKDGTWPNIDLFTGHVGLSKADIAEKWLQGIGVTFEECAYMWDDIADYQLLKKVGLAAAPVQAEKIVRDIAH